MPKPTLRPGFRVRYGGHARQRMALRRITDSTIRQVLAAGACEYNGVGIQGDDLWRSRGQVDGQTVEVIWTLSKDGRVQVIFVVTVIDTSPGKGW